MSQCQAFGDYYYYLQQRKQQTVSQQQPTVDQSGGKEGALQRDLRDK